MAEIVIEDPDEHHTDKKVDDRGRVHIGKKHAGKRVRVIVEVISEDEGG